MATALRPLASLATAMTLLACARGPRALPHDNAASPSASLVSPPAVAAPSSSAGIPLPARPAARPTGRPCASVAAGTTERALKRPIAGVMSYQGADWLDRPDRDATDKPDEVVAALGLHAGQRVADIGAGSGYFTLRLAARVGPSGQVLAVDVQPEMLAMVERRAKAAEVQNIALVRSTPRDLRLTEESVDLALLVDVFHEMEAPSFALAQLRCALVPGGRIVFVEFREEDPTVAIKPEHKMSLAGLRDEVEAAGFVFERAPMMLPRQHVAVFTR